MTFFNKKEEVLQIELTQYGKHLLSQGVFKPHSYAFFDDDILYDTRHVACGGPGAACGSGSAETQNEADVRIRFETPSLRPPHNISGVETRISEQNEGIRTSLLSAGLAPGVNVTNPNIAFAFGLVQPYEDRVAFSSYPLGTSRLTSDKYPAWEAVVLHNEFSSSFITGSITDRGIEERIPQINIDVNYQKFIRQGDLIEDPDSVSGYIVGIAGAPQESDQFYLAVNRNYVLLSILEHNAEFGRDNYEIEVFSSGSYGAAGTANVNPMSFYTTGSGVTNISNYSSLLNEGIADVEYYMDILVDEEIDTEIFADALQNDSRRNMFADATLQLTDRLGFSRNLYTTDDEGPCD